MERRHLAASKLRPEPVSSTHLHRTPNTTFWKRDSPLARCGLQCESTACVCFHKTPAHTNSARKCCLSPHAKKSTAS